MFSIPGASCFKRFENCTVKLSAKETKWTSLEVRTHPSLTARRKFQNHIGQLFTYLPQYFQSYVKPLLQRRALRLNLCWQLLTQLPIINNNVTRNHALSALFYSVKNLIRPSNNNTEFWLKQIQKQNSIWVTFIFKAHYNVLLCNSFMKQSFLTWL